MPEKLRARGGLETSVGANRPATERDETLQRQRRLRRIEEG